MDLQAVSIDELINFRKFSRENKKWEDSDAARSILDSKLVFVFDTKEGQEIYFLTNNYFDKKYYYSAKESKEAWDETQMQKIERLHNVKFDTKRKFVEWKIQNELRATKYFEAWLFSTLSSIE